MIKLLPLFITLLLVQSSWAQSKDEKYFVFDKDWKGTDIKKAVYFLHIKKLDDKEYQWTTYQMYGPRISQEVFRDEAGKVRNGSCWYYQPNGQLDSIGTCTNDLPTGKWWYYNNDGELIRKKEYENGRVMTDTMIAIPKTDTARKAKLDSSEAESSFKGGQQGWIRFLNRTTKYPERAISAHKEGMVVVEFIVDTEGATIEPKIVRSVEYSLDEESLRIINISPDWNPAFQFGRLVKSYKKQPFIYRL